MEKIQKIGSNNISVMGRFSLEVLRDKEKFRLTNINSFVPQGKTIEEKVNFKNSSGLIDYVMIDKLVSFFEPEKSETDYHNICVLIQHPDVRIAHMSEEEHRALVKKGLKKSNPGFKLTNIDYFEDIKHQKSVNLLKARNKIYTDEKLTKKVLIYICSNLGIPYRTEITNEKNLITFLQKQIDKFIQRKEENIVEFEKILNNINYAEKIYYINELIALEVIKDIGGIYKVKDIPVGPDIKSIISYFDSNPESYVIYKKMIIERDQNSVYN